MPSARSLALRFEESKGRRSLVATRLTTAPTSMNSPQGPEVRSSGRNAGCSTSTRSLSGGCASVLGRVPLFATNGRFGSRCSDADDMVVALAVDAFPQLVEVLTPGSTALLRCVQSWWPRPFAITASRFDLVQILKRGDCSVIGPRHNMLLQLTNRPPRLPLTDRFRSAGSQLNNGR